MRVQSGVMRGLGGREGSSLKDKTQLVLTFKK